MNEKLKIISPAGIGDWSWLWSKLWHVRDEIEWIKVLDGAPRRTAPYVELAGCPSGYVTGLTYETVCNFGRVNLIDTYADPTWDRVRSLGSAQVLLECNQHLEAGRRLEKWLEDLPEPNYHYPLYTTDEHRAKAAKLLANTVAPRVGISCASYQGSAAWNTWEADSWIDYLRRIVAEGWHPILIGGGWDDLTMTVADELDLPCLVGQTHIGTCVEILRTLESYIGFSSGLNVIRTVLDRPAMAFWPHHQSDLSTSWVPLDMLESRRYVARLWQPVDNVWATTRAYLRRCADEASIAPVRPNGHDTTEEPLDAQEEVQEA